MPEDQEPIREPAMWRHVQGVYEQMQAHTDEENVFEGFTTHLFQELKVPVPYYGKVLNALRDMGCITQMQRGGGNSPSRWKLHRAPVFEEFVALWGSLKDKPAEARTTALEQRIDDIEKRLQGIDVAVAIGDLQQQINRLKGDVPV